MTAPRRTVLIYQDGRLEEVPETSRRWVRIDEPGGARAFRLAGEAHRTCDDGEPFTRVYVERPFVEWEPDPTEGTRDHDAWREAHPFVDRGTRRIVEGNGG